MTQDQKRAKKLLFLITKATAGGAQKYVFDLATNLPPDTFEAALAFGERGTLALRLEERGVQTHHLPALSRDVSIFSDIESFFQILWLLKRERPDILHLNSSKAAALGALAGRIAGVKRIVFTVHGWPFKENRNVFATSAIRFISWFTTFLAHAMIVVSQEDEKIGKKMWRVGNKIHYIPLGIQPPEFLSREAAWQLVCEKVQIENLALPRIVTIAELTKNKGIKYGIEAIAELQKRNIFCNYFIIGNGELREELEQYAIEREVETRVYFLGFQENAARLIKAFDLFLLPSIKEGMPYVLLEAVAADLPIIATSAVDDSLHATRVPVANAAMLAEAMQQALESSPAIDTQMHTLRTMLQETVALY